MKKLKVIFCANPEFSVPTLELLASHEFIEIVAVVTNLDKPKGRGKKLSSPPVAQYAKDKKLKLFQTDNINKDLPFLEYIEINPVDLFVVVAFSQFLSTKILELPKLGCFNIHGSILPKYRGAAPIQYSILNGENKTGISIQRMVKKMDAGDVALVLEIPIKPHSNSNDLFELFQFKSTEAIDKFITLLVANNIQYIQQNENQATFAPIIKKEDGLIDFESTDYELIYNKLRAFSSWPGVYFFVEGKRIKIHLIEKVNDFSIKPGIADISQGRLLIGCKDATVHIKELQLEGKKRCEDFQYINGLQIKIISITKEEL